MLRHWCQYLFQPQRKVWIYTDHANLLFWKNLGEHNRRVARWHAELMEYDFELVHIAGARNGQADALSRRPDYDKGDEDNKKLVVLPECFFVHVRLAGTEWADPNNLEEWQRFTKNEDNVADYQSVHDRVMADQVNNCRQPLIKRWSNTHQLIHEYGHWWKGTQPVVASDNDLKRGVIQLFHNNPATKHPGIANTYALTKQDFWWPNMKEDIKQYVKGCAICQESKINTRPLKPTMIPITPENSLPFQTITMDFITKLPQSGGYDSILMIMDHDCSKAIILIPCKESITVEGVAALILKHVFARFGAPRKFISDQDTRFMSKVAMEYCNKFKIQQSMSTAYHPRTDGQAERMNQEAEIYLHMYCDKQQNDWHHWLPLAEFVHNQRPSSTTGQTPFSLIMGYTPKVEWPLVPSQVPSYTEKMEQIEQA